MSSNNNKKESACTGNSSDQKDIIAKAKSPNMQVLYDLEQIIFDLTEENLDVSIEQVLKFVDSNTVYSLNSIICNLIYSSFISQKNKGLLYINFIKILQTKEEEINSSEKTIDILSKYLLGINSHESWWLINQLIEQKLIDSNITNKIRSKYFAHYKTEEENKTDYYSDSFSGYFKENYDKLIANDYELHKKYIAEGINVSEISNIIRNDNVEKLQEISSQTNFDYNQAIQPSLYETCSFINKWKVSLVDYAAFFGSIKCFKYLLLNNAKLDNTGKYAVAGGNIEIVHLCEQNHVKFDNAYEPAIMFHRNDIFKYIYENKLEIIDEDVKIQHEQYDNDMNFLGFRGSVAKYHTIPLTKLFPKKYNHLWVVCNNYGNYEILSFLEEEVMQIDKYIINEAAKIGNLYLVKHYLQKYSIPNDILIFASESGNFELVKYILDQTGYNIKNINKKDVQLFNIDFISLI